MSNATSALQENDTTAHAGNRLEPIMLEFPGKRLKPDHTALLIIDMQKDFCADGFAAHRAGRNLEMTQGVIGRIARLLEAAREMNVLVVHVGMRTEPNHQSDSGPWLAQRRRSTFSAEKMCIANTTGGEFVDELKPLQNELTVYKRRYSGFTGTDLDLLLRGKGIKSVICCGVSTNVCVETTARAAFEHEYYVAVPSDACGSWDRDLHYGSLSNINHRFGITPTIDEIIQDWQRSIATSVNV